MTTTQYSTTSGTDQQNPPLKDLLLFTLLSSGDGSANYDMFSSEEFPSLSYAQLQWRLPEYSASSLRSAVSILQQEGCLSLLQREGKSFIRATAVGKERVFLQIPRAKWQKKRWDERWRVVIFAGVRDDRGVGKPYRLLRKALQAEGFVALSRGVYLSPFLFSEALRTQLTKIKALHCLTVLETRRFLFGDEKTFVHQVWSLDVLSKEYAKLRSRIVTLLRGLDGQKVLNYQSKKQIAQCAVSMFSLLQQDPGLPLQVLPEGFSAFSCWQRFCELAAVVMQKEKFSSHEQTSSRT